jgi:two-component system, sensor histidine kinase and response regulator
LRKVIAMALDHPLAVSQDSSEGFPPAPQSSPSARLVPSVRVLLAEDNLVNQRVVQRILEKNGHSVVLAGNGKKALEALRQETFDVLLMDVQMPEMDGLEATCAIRENEKTSGMHVPIIALTAHAMKGDQDRCIAAGMDGYLSKPIQAADLLNIIEALVMERPGQAPA